MSETLGPKALEKKLLIDALRELDDDCTLCCNRVGNLSIVHNNKGYIGYIDFSDGSIDLFDRE
jgi:hypothetical protein